MTHFLAGISEWLFHGNLCGVRLSPEPYSGPALFWFPEGRLVAGDWHHLSLFVLICLSLAGWQSGFSESDSESDRSLPISAVGKQLCLGSVGVLGPFSV